MSNEIYADHTQVFLLPPALDDWVPQDHLVRFLRDFVRELDLVALGFRVRQGDVGRPSYSSELLLSAWLYGYMERIRSSRKLEHACRTQLPLVWLVGMNYPDHNSLWRFFRDHRDAIGAVFRQSVLVAKRMNLLGMVVHALDGTKIAAQTSSRTALHRSSLEEVDAAIAEVITAMESSLEAESGDTTPSAVLPDELFEAKQRRQAIQAALGTLRERGQEHTLPTEPDARMMKLNTGRTGWAYNAQAVVDAANGVVVAQEVTNEASDYRHLSPMLNQVKELIQGTSQYTVADAGYRNATQEISAQEQGHNVVLPEHGRDAKNDNPYHKTCFAYDPQTDTYTCPQGKLLLYDHTLPPEGNRLPARVYRCRECKDCPVRDQCTRSRQGRTIRRDENDDFREERRLMRTRTEIQALIQKRKAIIEPLFGHIKENMGFRRWTARGLSNARAQWSMHCLSVNLKKIFHAWKWTKAPIPCNVN